jgi:SAM-dependent methyltransferase
MTPSIFTVQTDFDRIALLPETGWDHNSHYHPFLLKHIPAHWAYTLEIGCGTGAFSRLLATQSDQVLALDLSPNMIRIAQERSKNYANITYQVVDALMWEFPVNQFDCIVSIATMHHLPFENMLVKMKDALKVHGVLLILDLVQGQGLFDGLTSMVAVPVNIILRFLKTGQLREPPELRTAWAEHGRYDSYLTFSQIHQICQNSLPGAKINKHLLWRYSLVWKKPRMA